MTTAPARPGSASPAGSPNYEINLGLPCNNACVFCVNPDPAPGRKRAWAPLGEVLAEIEEAARRGYRALSLLGGEVTLYPQLLEVLAAARRAGMARVAVATNGRPLARPGALEALLDAGLTRITMSIHSHLAEVEDALCGRPGAFAEKIEALDRCVAAARAGRLPDGLAVNSCLHGRNAGALEAQVAAFRDRGVTDLRLNTLRPEREARGNAALVPRLAALAPELVRLVHQNERRPGALLTFGDVPLCAWPPALLGSGSFRRRYLGEVHDLSTVVAVLGAGNADGERQRFHWRERREAMFKAHPPACDGCAGRARCEGVWTGYLELHGAGELRPIPAGLLR